MVKVNDKNTHVKLLVTGGSGFIGTNVIDFYKNSCEIINIDIEPPRNQDHEKYWQKCDILDYEQYNSIVHNFAPDYYIHLAARTDLLEQKQINGYRANIDGVSNTIDILKEYGNIKRAIFASSRLVCRIDYTPVNDHDYCPPNYYGKSKVIGEQLVREIENEFEWIIVRPTSIWGPWFDVPYKDFFETIEKRRFVYPGKYNPKKSFGYVENTVYQLHQLLHADKKDVCKQTFYLCDYPPLELKAWSDLIRKEMHLERIKTIPFVFLRVLALTGDILISLGWHNFPLSTFRLNNIVTDMVYETKNLKKICGELPYSLHDGVKKTITFLKTTN